MKKDAWLEKFRKEALPLIIHQVQPEKVFVFGSRAHGTANEESDLDIIIISEWFQGIPFLERMPMILNRVPFAKHVDYLCYTPEEFRKVKQTSSILIDALSDPLELAVS
jgi:predicted nucleotidyltransferase